MVSLNNRNVSIFKICRQRGRVG